VATTTVDMNNKEKDFVKKAFVKVVTTMINTNSKEKEFTCTFPKTGRNGEISISSREKATSVTRKEEYGTVRTVWMRIDRNTLDFLRKNFDFPALFKICYLLAAEKLIKYFAPDPD